MSRKRHNDIIVVVDVLTFKKYSYNVHYTYTLHKLISNNTKELRAHGRRLILFFQQKTQKKQ